MLQNPKQTVLRILKANKNTGKSEASPLGRRLKRQDQEREKRQKKVKSSYLGSGYIIRYHHWAGEMVL